MEEGRERKQIRVKGDGAEGDINSFVEPFPIVVVMMKASFERLKRALVWCGEGENGPGDGVMSFSILEIRDTDICKSVFEQFEHCAGTLGDFDPEGLAKFIRVSYRLGDAPELYKVDISATKDDEDALSGEFLALFDHSGESHSAGWFRDAPETFPENAHRLAHLRIGNGVDMIQRLFADLKRELTCFADGGTVTE